MSRFSAEYVDAAHRAALWAEIRRVVTREILGGGERAREIVAEDAPYRDRFVSEKAALQVLRVIMQQEAEELEEIGEWQLLRYPTDEEPEREQRGPRGCR